MKTVSVRELQQNIKTVLERVERGEVIEVTRRRRLVARLTPVAGAQQRVTWPDLDERARGVLGDRIIAPSPSQQVGVDRGKH